MKAKKKMNKCYCRDQYECDRCADRRIAKAVRELQEKQSQSDQVDSESKS